jgi:hypothetical protein
MCAVIRADACCALDRPGRPMGMERTGRHTGGFRVGGPSPVGRKSVEIINLFKQSRPISPASQAISAIPVDTSWVAG